MGHKTPYEILGVSPEASHKEIVRAYRRLAVRYHPDKRADDGKFQIIKEAYESIIDKPEKEKSDTKSPPPIGKDLRISISASIKDVAECKTVTIKYVKKIICKKCDRMPCTTCGGTGRDPVSLIVGPLKSCKACSGTGYQKSNNTCRFCKGSGFVEENDSVVLTLNPMMTYPVIFRGKGNEGESGSGDLVIEVFIDKDRTYQISGLNLKRNLTVSPVQAILGDCIQLDVLGKQVDFIIPRMAHDGQMIKKDRAGLTYNGKTGDLYIILLIKMPQTITDQERRLYLEIFNIEKEKAVCQNP